MKKKVAHSNKKTKQFRKTKKMEKSCKNVLFEWRSPNKHNSGFSQFIPKMYKFCASFLLLKAQPLHTPPPFLFFISLMQNYIDTHAKFYREFKFRSSSWWLVSHNPNVWSSTFFKILIGSKNRFFFFIKFIRSKRHNIFFFGLMCWLLTKSN